MGRRGRLERRDETERRGVLRRMAVQLGVAALFLGAAASWGGGADAASSPDVAGEPVPFGAVQLHGSLGGVQLAQPVVGMAVTPDGGGYWLVASDGGVFSFGDARFHGGLGGVKLAQPVVGMAATTDGGGYWLVASDGGVFSFGDARFHGGLGGVKLAQRVVGMAVADAGGYWLTAADGGVFSFGDARFLGSIPGQLQPGQALTAPVIAIAASGPDGYWLAGADGGVFRFGNVPFYGSMGGQATASPIAAFATDRAGNGYWLLPTNPPPGALPVLTIPSVGYSGRFPTTIYFSGDSGDIVTGIAWSSWGAQQAVGHGTWTYDNCVPDCAQGSVTPYPATIILSQAVNGLYTQLEEVTSGPHAFTLVEHLGTPNWPEGASS
jgi:hypothetical protein